MHMCVCPKCLHLVVHKKRFVTRSLFFFYISDIFPSNLFDVFSRSLFPKTRQSKSRMSKRGFVTTVAVLYFRAGNSSLCPRSGRKSNKSFLILGRIHGVRNRVQHFANPRTTDNRKHERHRFVERTIASVTDVVKRKDQHKVDHKERKHKIKQLRSVHVPMAVCAS